MTLDYLGKELHIGDEVIIINQITNGFTKGIIGKLLEIRSYVVLSSGSVWRFNGDIVRIKRGSKKTFDSLRKQGIM